MESFKMACTKSELCVYVGGCVCLCVCLNVWIHTEQEQKEPNSANDWNEFLMINHYNEVNSIALRGVALFFFVSKKKN